MTSVTMVAKVSVCACRGQRGDPVGATGANSRDLSENSSRVGEKRQVSGEFHSSYALIDLSVSSGSI